MYYSSVKVVMACHFWAKNVPLGWTRIFRQNYMFFMNLLGPFIVRNVFFLNALSRSRVKSSHHFKAQNGPIAWSDDTPSFIEARCTCAIAHLKWPAQQLLYRKSATHSCLVLRVPLRYFKRRNFCGNLMVQF